MDSDDSEWSVVEGASMAVDLYWCFEVFWEGFRCWSAFFFINSKFCLTLGGRTE